MFAIQNERLAYSIEEFMAVTGYSRNKTYAAISRGELKTLKDGKRRLISASAAREFIAQRERATAQSEAAA